MELRMQLKIARIESEWTMQQLADKANIAKSQISEIESGKKSPTAKTIIKVCDALGYELRIVKKGA